MRQSKVPNILKGISINSTIFIARERSDVSEEFMFTERIMIGYDGGRMQVRA